MTKTLQKLSSDTKRLATQLYAGKSRIYQISSEGKITERTGELRDYLRRSMRAFDKLAMLQSS